MAREQRAESEDQNQGYANMGDSGHKNDQRGVAKKGKKKKKKKAGKNLGPTANLPAPQGNQNRLVGKQNSSTFQASYSGNTWDQDDGLTGSKSMTSLQDLPVPAAPKIQKQTAVQGWGDFDDWDLEDVKPEE